MTPRHAILIAGMHRSGTSALARAVNLLGAEIGEGLLPPKFDNPRGYWEVEAVVALNDECLAHFGLRWDDPWPLPEGWLDDPWTLDWQRRVAHHVTAQFENASLFAIKDPRLSRLLPAWLVVLQELDIAPHVLVSIREPAEVAASMHKRSNMPAPRALLLWLVYTIDAERNSRDVSRAFVRFGQLLTDPDLVLNRIAQQLGIDWLHTVAAMGSEIHSFLEVQLRHHHVASTGGKDDSEVQYLAAMVHSLAVAACNQAGEAAIVPISGTGATAPWQSWEEANMKLQKDLSLLKELLPAMQPDSSPPPAPEISDAENLWVPAEIATSMIEARLYFRAADHGLNEHDHVAVIIDTTAQPLRASFCLPADAVADFVRFDPATRAGIFRILGITIGGKLLHTSDLKVSAVHHRLLRNRHGELLRLFSDDDDPYVEFDIRKVSRPQGQPTHMEVVYECDSLLDQLRRDAAGHELAISDALAQVERRLTEIKTRHKQAEERIDAVLAALLRRQEAQDRFRLLASGWRAHGRMQKPIRRSIFPSRGKHLRAVPSQQLQLLAQDPESNLAWWHNDGGDPYFKLELPRAKPLPAGWYVLAMEFCGADAPVSNPCIYADYRDGFNEDDRIPLIASPMARQRLLLHFKRPVRALRFDPSDAEAGEFLLSPMHLRRITAVEALLRLGLPAVRKMRGQGHGWGTIWRESQRAFASKNLGAAVETLYANQATADDNGAYQAWIAACDTLTDDDRAEIREHIKGMVDPPLISILLPTYNTPELLLRACLDSVLAQLYPHWELCIADDASTTAHVRTVLENYAARDPRIKITFRDSNGHISAASNSALELATGNWIALLDHDDMLPEHALYHVAIALLEHPVAGLIYSDEDKINEHGFRYAPYFKPDWNPDLLRAQNFICHLGIYSADLVREVGGFREGYEGSQDHDLALRCVERLVPNQIVHIPKILYHWRATSGSTALAASEKNYTQDAAVHAVSDHLSRIGFPAAEVSRTSAGYMRIKYPLPNDPPKVSLIIPTRDGVDLLKLSVGSILQKTDYENYEIIVVDNQSCDPATLNWFREITASDPRVRILKHNKRFNFSRINNEAVLEATGEIVGLVNNDIEITDGDWLREMVSQAIRDGVGAVGAKLYYPDGTIQHAGVIVGYGGVAGHAYCHMPHDYSGQMGRACLTQNIGAVTAACLVIKKSIYEEVGGMNEDLEVAFNDIDFCLKVAEAGYRNLWTPYAELTHHESATRGYEDTPEKQARFNTEVRYMQTLWGNTLMRDPAYNPNLALERQPYSLAISPRTNP